MVKFLSSPTLALAALCCALLTACGGGNDAPDTSRVLQESALYNPVTHPTGSLEQPGETVVLGLEATASDLPPPTGVPTQGVEDLWFDVADSQPMQFALDAETLAAIARVEIRDASDTVLGTLSSANPATTLELAPGRYQALVVASAADTAPVPVFVQYRAGSGAATQMQGAQAAGRVQPQTQYTINVTNNTSRPSMFFLFQCVQCNMQGASQIGWTMTGRDFHGSSFKGADLSGTEFKMSVLTDTNFQGANLTGANFTGANLMGTNFLNADLSNATWVDGVHRCAPGSIGVCK